MQFGIAARQPAGVAVGGRRLVGERREGDDLGPGAPPAADEMRIDERKGLVARERDPLARAASARSLATPRRNRSSPARARTRSQSTCASTKSAIASRRASSASVSPACTSPRWRSGSATLSSRGIAPTTGIPSASIASVDEPPMPLAADAVDDDAGDPQALIVGRAALDDGRRRLRLTRDVDDQEHRQAERRRDVGRGAAASGAARARRRTGPSRLRTTPAPDPPRPARRAHEAVRRSSPSCRG